MPLQSLKRETSTRDGAVQPYIFTTIYAKGLPVKHEALKVIAMEMDRFLKIDEKDFKARMLERISISFSRGSSRPRDRTCISCIGRWTLYCSATREAPVADEQPLNMRMNVVIFVF